MSEPKHTPKKAPAKRPKRDWHKTVVALLALFMALLMVLPMVTMVLQSAGLAASFTLRGESVKDVVLTGALTQLPQAGEQFAFMGECFGLGFHLPEMGPYATALGAVLCPEESQVEIQADG